MTASNKQEIFKIAFRNFGLETLETRNNDNLDFHDLAVWSIKDALEEAYQLGLAAGKKTK
jgi:hypothetical protein